MISSGDRETCIFQIANGLHYVGIGHVAMGIVILADGQDARVFVLRLVKGGEVIGVPRDKGQPLRKRVVEVGLIVHAGGFSLRGSGHAMPGSLQKSYKLLGVGTIIEVYGQAQDDAPVPLAVSAPRWLPVR